MKKIIHKESERGKMDHGWLKTNYSFSFGSWYNPEKINFGALRVINDDYVEASKGFPTHPHENMEIITIPLKGQLEHKDSMGNGSVISAGEIQMMSAGSGVEHSEFNPSDSEGVSLLQIWIFPKIRNIKPSYGQLKYDDNDLKNNISTLISPKDDNGKAGINQNAWLSLSRPDAGKELKYEMKESSSGVYIFIIEGTVDVEGEQLVRRDAIGISETNEIRIKPEENSFVLFLEVPMEDFMA